MELTGSMSPKDIKGIFNPVINERDEGNYNATYSRWIPQAITEAQKLDIHPDSPFPDCPGTRVYRLVEELMK